MRSLRQQQAHSKFKLATQEELKQMVMLLIHQLFEEHMLGLLGTLLQQADLYCKIIVLLPQIAYLG
ncbi:MAG: hypothetical protein EBY83_05850, partial [Verrucomicrobia bacterium]|nr:hypothetical protein [Verrucomicrobiota bacterium]